MEKWLLGETSDSCTGVGNRWIKDESECILVVHNLDGRSEWPEELKDTDVWVPPRKTLLQLVWGVVWALAHFRESPGWFYCAAQVRADLGKCLGKCPSSAPRRYLITWGAAEHSLPFSGFQTLPCAVVHVRQETEAFVRSWTEKAMAPHSSTLAWKIPWEEEPGRLRSMGSLRVGHDWSDLAAAARSWKAVVVPRNLGWILLKPSLKAFLRVCNLVIGNDV